MKIYRDRETGKKLYPVCNWEQNQHKLYNALDRINNAIYDAEEDNSVTVEECDRLYNRREQIEEALFAFDSHVIQGLVYATYEDSLVIKDIVAAYNARH